ncbi:MAG: hypothetical protein AAGA54_11430 [Myxococcota bacterium]
MDGDGRKASAERSALLGLAAILTHDLSNPLQSITVLCELGLDDDDPAEAPRRSRQCLEATERMRTLLHSYASVVRNVGREGKVSASLDRITPMFGRRLERHRIELQAHVEVDFEAPGCLEFSLVTMFLGMIEAVGTNGPGPCTAHIVIDSPALTLQLQRAGGAAVEWPGDALDNMQAVLGAEGSCVVDGDTLTIRYEGVAR